MNTTMSIAYGRAAVAIDAYIRNEIPYLNIPDRGYPEIFKGAVDTARRATNVTVVPGTDIDFDILNMVRNTIEQVKMEHTSGIQRRVAILCLSYHDACNVLLRNLICVTDWINSDTLYTHYDNERERIIDESYRGLCDAINKEYVGDTTLVIGLVDGFKDRIQYSRETMSVSEMKEDLYVSNACEVVDNKGLK